MTQRWTRIESVLGVLENLTPPDRSVTVTANGSHNSSVNVSVST